MASDSQMSGYPNSTAKQVGYPKLGCITFKDGCNHAMIAKAGSLMMANKFEDLFASEAAQCVPVAPRSIADLAESVMKRVRADLMSIFLESPPWSEEMKRQRLIDYNCEVMLAYYFKDKPCIYTMELDACAAERRRQPFAGVGCAANVITSVLTGFDLMKMASIEALGLAVYAIETCKANDMACGGDVQMGIIKYPAIPPYFFDRDVLRDYESAALKTAKESKANLAEKIAENFKTDRVDRGRVFWLSQSKVMQPSPAASSPSSEPHPSSPKPGQQSPPASQG